MKLKDIMPFTNEQESAAQLKKISADNYGGKNISNSKLDSEAQKILKTYNQVIISGYEKLRKDELELLKMVIFRIENDPEYTPSPSVVDFTKSIL